MATTTENFLVECSTSKGSFSMTFHRSWSPLGYGRLLALFQDGYYDSTYLYRVVPNFLVQFGVSSDDVMKEKWSWKNSIQDDPLTPERPFKKGTISFAGAGPNTRSADLFISYSANPGLGKSPWESPVGEVTSGMNVVESFKSYGDISAFNKKGPNPNKIRNQGSEYVASELPEMDYFKRCSIAVPASAKVKTAMVASMESASSGSVFDGGLLLVNVLIMVISGIAVLVILSRICFGKRGRRKAARALNADFEMASLTGKDN
ncbi:hypothetical protein TrVE_jg2139 [Triparma verrucosa]|uniref:Peptidyl-prolyl cis-trans isomerase n=1 Tax=Triparma verrucosa TaxID=1606542 RepID=A0A9W7B2Q7_9STRA|nr:hypothetical protein TrVE_jg2139 [Triparma verrucosa]